MDLAFSISDLKEEELINTGGNPDIFSNQLFFGNNNSGAADSLDDAFGPDGNSNNGNSNNRNGNGNGARINTTMFEMNDNNPQQDTEPIRRHSPETPEDINVVFEREQMKEKMQETRLRELSTKKMPLIEAAIQEEAYQENYRQKQLRKQRKKQMKRERMQQAQPEKQSLPQAQEQLPAPLLHNNNNNNNNLLTQIFGMYTIECMFLCGVIFGIILMLIFRKSNAQMPEYIAPNYHEYTPFSPFVMPKSFYPAQERVNDTNFAIIN
jgi:hypothetical protein